MKKCILFLLFFLGIASSATAQEQPFDTDGDGYINISTLDHLRWVSETSSSWDKNFELDNNINAAATVVWNDSAGFSPIGNTSISFTGKFEGNGFAIDSLYINRPDSNYVSLFGKTSGAKISNIGIRNCNFTGNECVGGLIGYINYSTIDKCYSAGYLSGNKLVGGLIGYNNRSKVSNSYCNANISAISKAGGLIGRNSYSTVNNCNSNSSVSCNEFGGGLIGYNDNSTVANCYTTGQVSGSYLLGGLIGNNIESLISNCYSTENITGKDYVGGLLGNNNESTVINSYCTGSVAGDSYVGGLVGMNISTTVNNCYSLGNVIGSSNVGGLVGNHTDNSILVNSYSIGKVSGSYYIGGLVGYTYSSTINNCFWDTQTSEKTTSVGGTGKTTAEMKAKSTFTYAGWDFNLVWSLDSIINNGYPYINERGISFYPGIEPLDTDGDGYRNISCYSHLHWISNNDSAWSWNFELDNNINADSSKLFSGNIGFSPIGTLANVFSGKFEGHGFTIDSLYINRPRTSCIGLFGITSRSQISNVGITNCQVIGNDGVGGLVGFNYDSSSVSKCYSTGEISGGGQCRWTCW